MPSNLRLLFLPAYAPELNPVEHLWDDLREKSFHNRVFDSIASLEKHLEQALADVEHLWDDLREKSFHNRVFDSIASLEKHLEQALADFEQSPKRARGIAGLPWIISALSN
jgi:phosphorylcholine metabolism protein LicD